jgi:flagellar operon protein
MSNGTFLYPNVTSLPGQAGVAAPDGGRTRKSDGAPGEFDQTFEKALKGPAPLTTGKESGGPLAPGNPTAGGLTSDLGQVKSPLKFSAHASQRLRERKIELDQATMTKVHDAVDKADAKGIDDTLVLTKDAALIVNVKNRTVITAMDRAQMTGNVFTNIDGAVIV